MSDSRKEFEAWWQKRRRQTWMDQRCRGDSENPPDGWSSAFKPHAWEGWQAARRAALEEAVKVCAKESVVLATRDQSRGALHCSSVLRALAAQTGQEGVK